MTERLEFVVVGLMVLWPFVTIAAILASLAWRPNVDVAITRPERRWTELNS